MLFGVPQFINIEDKIVGPFTAKQLGWFAALGAILLILWMVFDILFFFIFGIPSAIFILGFAFLKPNNQSFLSFIMSMGYFLFSSKTYVWRREEVKSTREKIEKEPEKAEIKKETLKAKDIKELAEVLDSRGSNNIKEK